MILNTGTTSTSQIRATNEPRKFTNKIQISILNAKAPPPLSHTHPHLLPRWKSKFGWKYFPQSAQGIYRTVIQMSTSWWVLGLTSPRSHKDQGRGVTGMIMVSASPLLSCPIHHCCSIAWRSLPSQGQLVSKLPSSTALLRLQTFGEPLLLIRTPAEGSPAQKCWVALLLSAAPQPHSGGAGGGAGVLGE